MDIIQGLIETGNAGKSGWRIVNNGGAIGVLNNRTSNVYFSILNDGGIGTSSNVPSSLINSYSGINVSNYSGSGNVVSTGGTGGTGGSSQWTTSGSKIYYNNGNVGNVGIGTLDPIAPLHIYNNAITAVLPTEIVVAGATSATISGTTDRYISFPYSGSATTKDYTFTTTEALICDILIVGGGGAGGTVIGGGGGAGSIIYATNFNISEGSYTINVGRGGIATTATSGGGAIVGGSGASSSAFGATALGGGGGGIYNGVGGVAGGSGGGGGGGVIQASGGAGGSFGASGSKIIGGTIIPSATFKEYLSNDGGYVYYYQNGGNSQSTIAGGGGGAGGVGGGTRNDTTKTSANGNGGDGKSYDITGTSITYGGGGGAGGHKGSLASISNGLGGSGGGGNGVNDTTTSSSGTQGDDGKGGGGGGSSYNSSPTGIKGGNGGSGIVIIRYRRQTQPSVSNARLLLDATTTGTATVEFRRGTGADAQNDYRFINDSNGSLKLQCENTTQVFGNTVADLAWFSSNETIIHKNTTMNGRVGIGTVYHASRSLDVVGDANVSGVLSVAGSLSVTSNAIITNSITSNTSFTIHNGLLPPLPNEITVVPLAKEISAVPLANEIVVAGTTSGIIGADRYIIFTSGSSAFNVPTGGINCDIFMIGGGGGGGNDCGGGGGAGASIIAINQFISTGNYTVSVGAGGVATTPYGGQNGSNGGDSSIGSLYVAKGGGAGNGGGTAGGGPIGGCSGGSSFNSTSFNNTLTSTTNVVNSVTNISPSTTTTYSVLGRTGGNSASPAVSGQFKGGGGGGIGASGTAGTSTVCGVGGTGIYEVTINSTTYNLRSHFTNNGTFGVQDGTTSNYYVGGGGGAGGWNGSGGLTYITGGRGGGGNGADAGTAVVSGPGPTFSGLSATANTGGGGGGGAGYYGIGGNGGSGIVIIRYRKPPAEITTETTSGIIGGDRVIMFPYTGTGTTKDYSFTTTENLICDILVVGGGGGGGHNHGGGGGGGAVVFINSVVLNNASYTIKVGAGGAKGTRSTTNFGGLKGNDTIITLNGTDILKAEGGGGGGQGSTVGSIGNGGSGGGGDGYRDALSVYNNGVVGTGSIKNYNGTTGVLYGNNGGSYYLATSGTYINKAGAGGGGGGAGQIGSNATKVNVAGNGGNGISSAIINGTTYNFVDLFGTTYGTNDDNNNTRYFGGGGGGGTWAANAGDAPAGDIGGTVISGSGGKGGGGLGALQSTTNGFSGSANTGGGGGGGSYGAVDSSVDGGNGGSGIVIIRYRKPPGDIITETISGIVGTTDRYTIFPYTGTGTTKDYSFTTTESLSCDILVVGGGGGGAKTDGGGGGAGGLLYIQNTSLNGNYTVSVGKGGLGGASVNQIGLVGNKGNNSSFLGTNANYIAYGGGGGGYGWPSKVEPSNLGPYGSSGGLGTGDQTREFFNVNTSGQGYLGGLGTASQGGGGGGGSGGIGVNSGNGGIGTQINITGSNLYYAGGGGGGHNPNGTSGGLGGGGSATFLIGNNATYYGGGGGGGGANAGDGGNGFEGIVIVRYRKLPKEIVVAGTTSTVIGSTDRCIVFPYTGSASTTDYSFTTTEALSCDILIVGGGGGGACFGGGGGGGQVLYAINLPLSSSSALSIQVGRGGITTQPLTFSENGISSTLTIGGITYTANGGGGGAGRDRSNYASFRPAGGTGGSGGGGQAPDSSPDGPGGISNKTNYAGWISNGNAGGIGTGLHYGGGGGGAGAIGGNGVNLTSGGIGGVGVNLGSTFTTTVGASGWFGGGGGGVTYQSGTAGTGGTGGGGAGGTWSPNVPNGVNGTANTGGGGGSSGLKSSDYLPGIGGAGGSGIVIIRYRLPSAISSSSINFIRGTTADTNNDYKVGNFNGEFKVISSVTSGTSNIDTDYIRITTAGAITNPSGTANWNIGSDRRIKENIERASYDKCFENINRLELNRFNYVSGFNTVNRDRTQLGFIAQEVYDVFPKSISSQGYYSDTLNIPDLLSIDISQINYSLYGAVKKLIEINNDKDNRLKALDDELKTIETILNITQETVASNVVLEPVISMTSNVVLEEMTSNITVDS